MQLLKHHIKVFVSYLCKTEFVHALGNASLCSPHVLRFFGGFEQQSLFILNSHTTLKEVNCEHTEQVHYTKKGISSLNPQGKKENTRRESQCLSHTCSSPLLLSVSVSGRIRRKTFTLSVFPSSLLPWVTVGLTASFYKSKV